MAYTPGPWDICADSPNHQWYEGLTIFNPKEGTRVADVCPLTSRWPDNARLIAAAPRLLEKLRTVTRRLETLVEGMHALGLDGNAEFNSENKQMAAESWAAIAEATGET